MFSSLSRILGFEKIHEINERYRTGKLKLGAGSRFVLFLLKIYVILMAVLLSVKLYQIMTGGGM